MKIQINAKMQTVSDLGEKWQGTSRVLAFKKKRNHVTAWMKYTSNCKWLPQNCSAKGN
jgi:hypothetical protein